MFTAAAAVILKLIDALKPLHKFTGDAVEFVLILDGLQKFLAVFHDDLQYHQFAGIVQDVLRLFGTWNQGHIAVILKLHDVRNLEFMLMSIFIHQGQDIRTILVFILGRQILSPFLFC